MGGTVCPNAGRARKNSAARMAFRGRLCNKKAGVITKTTGQRALAELLGAGTIERIGKGGMRQPYLYWHNGKGSTS